ncbi:unnamed protein product [Closterium sp. NIES-53]
MLEPCTLSQRAEPSRDQDLPLRHHHRGCVKWRALPRGGPARCLGNARAGPTSRYCHIRFTRRRCNGRVSQEADLLQPNDTYGGHVMTSSPLRSAGPARACPVNGIAPSAAGEEAESALGVVGGEEEIARGGGDGDGVAYMGEKARAAEATGDAVDGSTYAAIGGGGDPQDGKNGGGEGGEGHADGKENSVGNLEGTVDEGRGTPAGEALEEGGRAEGGQPVGGQPIGGEGSCNAEQQAVAEGESGALIQGEGIGDGEKEEAGAGGSGEGEGVLVVGGTKEACENGERGERKVRWLDDEGQTLTDVREFEPSESSSDDDDEHYKESSHKCSCTIL